MFLTGVVGTGWGMDGLPSLPRASPAFASLCERDGRRPTLLALLALALG